MDIQIFTKDFKTETHGQIVVMKDLNEKDLPCYNLFFKTPETENVKMSIGFKTEEERDISFDQVTEEKAKRFIDRIKEEYGME